MWQSSLMTTLFGLGSRTIPCTNSDFPLMHAVRFRDDLAEVCLSMASTTRDAGSLSGTVGYVIGWEDDLEILTQCGNRVVLEWKNDVTLVTEDPPSFVPAVCAFLSQFSHIDDYHIDGIVKVAQTFEYTRTVLRSYPEKTIAITKLVTDHLHKARGEFGIVLKRDEDNAKLLVVKKDYFAVLDVPHTDYETVAVEKVVEECDEELIPIFEEARRLRNE